MPPEAMTSRFAATGESPGFLLWRISNAWQQRQRAALQPLGLTHVQFVLLASLVWQTQHGASVTQTDLAAQAQTDPMMTSQVVRALEARGLLIRATSPEDRRARVLAPTSAGIALAAAAITVVEAVDAACFAEGDAAWLQGLAQRLGLPGVADGRARPSTAGINLRSNGEKLRSWSRIQPATMPHPTSCVILSLSKDLVPKPSGQPAASRCSLSRGWARPRTAAVEGEVRRHAHDDTCDWMVER